MLWQTRLGNAVRASRSYRWREAMRGGPTSRVRSFRSITGVLTADIYHPNSGNALYMLNCLKIADPGVVQEARTGQRRRCYRQAQKERLRYW